MLRNSSRKEDRKSKKAFLLTNSITEIIAELERHLQLAKTGATTLGFRSLESSCHIKMTSHLRKGFLNMKKVRGNAHDKHQT